MKSAFAFVAVLALPCLAAGTVVSNQQPVSGGGTSRWSQLWQDPSGNGNNLDGDSVCWEDFTLSTATAISHIEWWGNGACELGFQIEFWRQDPGTIAYQPLAVFYYGGANPPPNPEAMFTTTSVVTSPGPGGLTHYVLDLATPVTLAANDASNPRWFIGIVGLTNAAYYTWNWAQGLGGSTHTFQFIRGGTPGGGNLFWVLPEGRALVLGNWPRGDLNCDGVVNFLDINPFVLALTGQAAYQAQYPNCNWLNADANGDGVVNFADINPFVALLSGP